MKKVNKRSKTRDSFSQKGWFKYNEYVAINVSIDSSIFLGILANIEEYALDNYHSRFVRNEGYFMATNEFIKSRVGLNSRRQKVAYEELNKLGVLSKQNKFGNRLFYQIDWEILDTLLDEWWIKAEKIKSLNNGIKELYDNEEYSDEI